MPREEQLEKVVREVFKASDEVFGTTLAGRAHTSEEHIQRTVQQLHSNVEAGARVLDALGVAR